MADTAPGQPMEDILASIKRIIQDDTPPPSPAAIEADESEDVLELGEPSSAPQAAQAAPQPPVVATSLVSGIAEAASRQAFAALSSVSVDPAADANTLDGLVRELLRPMLQQWLDQNLPAIVERLVAREVARLGGR